MPIPASSTLGAASLPSIIDSGVSVPLRDDFWGSGGEDFGVPAGVGSAPGRVGEWEFITLP
jgi:hypothetical protein